MDAFAEHRRRDRTGRAEPWLAAAALAVAIAGLALGGDWRWPGIAALLALGALFLASRRRSRRAEAALAQSRHDYRQLIDLPAQATWLASPEGEIVYISERWTEWTGATPGVGRSGPEHIHPDDRERVLASWAESQRTGRPHDQDQRILMRDGRYRWMRARAFPQRDAEGRIVRWVGQLEDIHERRVAEEQLRQTAGLLEMIGTSTESIIYAKDCEGRMLYGNLALERLSGIPLSDMLGRTDIEWNPNRAEAEAFSAADRRVLDSGQGQDIEEVFTGRDGRTRRYRSLKSPLRDRSGKVIGLVGVSSDITEQREAAEREALLSRELDHRAKNLLAVVQSVVALTRADTLAEFKEAVEGRLMALGRAHSMLAASRWEGAELERVLAEELAPFRGQDLARVQLSGPELVLRPAAAQSLALVIHELATNAAKYGSLSVPSGELRVEWSLDVPDQGSSRLHLTWAEQGGPPVPPRDPGAPTGFGSRLIRSSIERQLGGTLDVDWAESGLVVRFEAPLERSSAGQTRETRGGGGDERQAPETRTDRMGRRRAA